ncbi:MAG: CHAP domain-containing protein [Moraxella sp.]|nr:CHAP domain-containing protein [Moraxella sp.]
MKRVFWLMSAVGLTFGQSSIAQSNNIQATQAGYVNVSGASNAVNIDNTINQLIARQSATAATYTYQPSNTASTVSTTAQYSTTSNFSSNYQSPIEPAQLTASSAPSVAAKAAARAAHGKSIGRCALYVRRALQSAGYEFTPNPSAYQYAHGTLASAGFTKISNDNYQPQVGDVVVFNRTSRNPHGHIQIYDGNQWVSDYRQPKFSPYTTHNGYTVWRDMRYTDASANTGIMLALNDQ